MPAISAASLTQPQDIKFGVDARASMLSGIELLTKAVSSTLGPKGAFASLFPAFFCANADSQDAT